MTGGPSGIVALGSCSAPASGSAPGCPIAPSSCRRSWRTSTWKSTAARPMSCRTPWWHRSGSAPVPRSPSLGLEPRRYAVSVGRLVPEKGVHVLAEAYAAAETDIPLVIVGEPSGTEEYVAEIRARHEGDRVRFVGAHYAEAFQELMSSARLFVTAAELEGLPTALIEAGLYELPIVATDIGPHAEVLAGGPSESWTCPVGDVRGLTDAIEAALAAGGELNGAGAASPSRPVARPARAGGVGQGARVGVRQLCSPAGRDQLAAPRTRAGGAGHGARCRPAARPAGDAHRSRGRAGELRAAWDQLCADRPTVQWTWIASGGGSTRATMSSPCSLSGPGRGSSVSPRGTSRRRSAVRTSSPSAPARSPPTTAGSSPTRRTPPRSASPSPTTCSDRSGPVGVGVVLGTVMKDDAADRRAARPAALGADARGSPTGRARLVDRPAIELRRLSGRTVPVESSVGCAAYPALSPSRVVSGPRCRTSRS